MFSCNLPPALLAEWSALLRATAVTRGWNGYRNKSQNRKLTLEKKILPPFLQGTRLTSHTFRSWVRRSNHWVIPPLQEPHCPVSSCCYILSMGGPGEVTADGDAQAVLAGNCCFQCLPMEEAAGCQDFSLLVTLGITRMTLHLHG